MPKKVKTRRQRKRAAAKENVAKEEQTSHPEVKSSNLESTVITDKNLAKHTKRPSRVLPSEEEKKVAITSKDKLVKKKAAHKRGQSPKETRNVGKLGNALDKDEGNYSSVDLTRAINEDELLDQLWKDLNEIFPSDDEDVTKGGLAPNVDLVKQPANQKSSDKLVKKNAAYRGQTSSDTSNTLKLGNDLDKDKEKKTTSELKAEFDQILKGWEELLPTYAKALAKVGDKGITSNENLIKKKAAHQRGGNPARTSDDCELGIALDEDEEPFLSLIDDEEFDQILKDLEEVDRCPLSPKVDWEKKSGNQESSILADSKPANGLPLVSPSEERKDEAVTSTDKLIKKKAAHRLADSNLANGLPLVSPSEEGKAEHTSHPGVKSSNLESTVITDKNLDKHIKRPPLVSPSEEEKKVAITSNDKLIKKKAAHRRSGTSKGSRNAWELGNGHPRQCKKQYYSSAELDNKSKDRQDIYSPGGETEAKVSFYPNIDCSTPGEIVEDSGPVPPKFFGNSSYFMLTGTNSQLQQQIKDLAARNIFVESFVELPAATADIVEQQMTELLQNRDQILGKMCDKYEPRRVSRQKKQRKCLKKTDN